MGTEVVEEYLSSLTDLTVNSKPLINMLTMLAEENSAHAAEIVAAIESHIEKVSMEVKLPIMYLIDSIIKNVSAVYAPIFTNNIVQLFASVFEKADEKTRIALYKLRQTWNDIFPARKLYTLDLRIKHIDENWPLLTPTPSIHINPKFLNNAAKNEADAAPAVPDPKPSDIPAELQATHRKKQQILLELQQKKRELEQIQARVLFGESTPQAIVRPVLNEEAAKNVRSVIVPRATPRAVVLPPAPSMATQPLKTKIAPANSDLIAAAKSRDPRLARMQPPLKASSEPSERVAIGRETPKDYFGREKIRTKDSPKKDKEFKKETKPERKADSPKKKKSPLKAKEREVEKVVKKEVDKFEKKVERKVAEKKDSEESESDLLEELLRSQKNQAAARAQAQAVKSVEPKVPEVIKVEEDRLQLRQMAMLKAPVLGQINNKTAEPPKPKLRAKSPVRREERLFRNPDPPMSPASDDSLSPPKHRDRDLRKYKSRQWSGKRQRREERRPPKYSRRSPSPRFSPEPPENGVRSIPHPVTIIESSPSPEPPPPPVIGPDALTAMDVEEERPVTPPTPPVLLPPLPPVLLPPAAPPTPVGFKSVKTRSRNYSRRNKDRSPSPTGDVDHRVTPEDMSAVAVSQTDKPKEDIVDVGKDVDLRVLSRQAIGSPKKRMSTGDPEDEPPIKRGKQEDILQLFGNKDMDERRPPLSVALPVDAPAPPLPPLPPPPPKSVTPPHVSPKASMDTEEPTNDGSSETWAEVKHKSEDKENSHVTPLSRELELRIADIERAERERESINPEPEHPSPAASPVCDKRDRLGRLLLYDRLPDDPQARRESLHQDHHRGRMRRDMGRNVLPKDVPIDVMLHEVKEQLERGIITQRMYSDVVLEMFRMSEDRKIREMQEQMSFGGPRGRGRNFAGQDFRKKGPWGMRMRQDEEPPFARRGWRGGRGGPRGGGPRMNAPWPESRFMYANRSPDWGDNDSRSQDAWGPGPELLALPLVPPTDPLVLEQVTNDHVKHISIDGTPRAIRYYGPVAVVLLSFSNAREIAFENGPRRVFIAGLEIPCQLNGPPMPFIFQKDTHAVRLGGPTRELYIDERWYEVHFGGPPAQVQLGGLPCPAQLEGPPPQVRISPQSTDLCLGSVCLIVDARTSFPIYLDAKPQRFEINKRPLILKFINRLCTVLINDVPIPLQFGGAPVAIDFLDAQHYLRLTELPPGVTPGKVNIRGLDGPTGSPLHHHDNSMEAPPSPPPETKPVAFIPPPATTADVDRGAYMEMISTTLGAASEGEKEVGFNYSVDLPLMSVPPPPLPPILPPKASPPVSKLNIADLFNSLLASGIIAKPGAVKEVIKIEPKVRPVHPVDIRNQSTFNRPQPGLVDRLYSGIQCSSCGVRFPPEETAKYSQHLDWHFRQNRRERDILRRGSSRRWYYDISDWVQFEEIEDLEERAQSWFETEGAGADDDASREAELKSVPAPADSAAADCHICHDKFDTFYNEDTEEWHLRNCILVDDLYYHPLCYEDSLKTSELLSGDKLTSLPLLAPLKEDAPVKMEESVVVLEDDDVLEDTGDVEIVTADETEIESLVESMICSVIADEECEKLEDDELEVLPVNKEENRPPIDVIDVPDLPDDEVYGPPSPAVFDPEKEIKAEPLDELDMEKAVAQVDQTMTTLTTSMDGNIELAEAPAAPAPTASKIKITFTRPTVVPVVEPPKIVVDDTPIDPSELQVVQFEPDPLPLKPKKPRLADKTLSVFPPVERGTELSGLCSIM